MKLVRESLFPISESTMEMCIEALRYMAHSEAAQSQSPALFRKEDTPEWALAVKLEERLVRLREKRNAK